jgi:peptidoglycan/xylan/chitin deacetylase (PgdA/CDA1 family)
LVINYEEGAERSVLEGDPHGETYLADTGPQAPPTPGQRMLTNESIYEYGSRLGIWRLMRIITERGLTATVFACGRAVEINPEPVVEMHRSGFEIASHHYRWIDYANVPIHEEADHLRRSVAAIEQATGERPVGFYHWSGPNTRRLVVEEGGFLYDSEAYNDELPYWTEHAGKCHLVIPYALDTNDYRYALPSGWTTGDDFLAYAKATFDQLYEEGATTPGLMSLGLHARLSGRPGRARALAAFLDHARGHQDVWICTRRQIAEHWRDTFPPGASDRA